MRSFDLLCVLDLFFRTLAVNSVSDFFFQTEEQEQKQQLEILIAKPSTLAIISSSRVETILVMHGLLR